MEFGEMPTNKVFFKNIPILDLQVLQLFTLKRRQNKAKARKQI